MTVGHSAKLSIWKIGNWHLVILSLSRRNCLFDIWQLTFDILSNVKETVWQEINWQSYSLTKCQLKKVTNNTKCQLLLSDNISDWQFGKMSNCQILSRQFDRMAIVKWQRGPESNHQLTAVTTYWRRCFYETCGTILIFFLLRPPWTIISQ